MVKSGPISRTIEQILEILYSKTEFEDKTGCFVWQGRTVSGYGSICYQGKEVYIHRLIYNYVHSEECNVIRHSCDNKRCWCPDHLFNGTHYDNVLDKVNKQRHLFGEVHYKSILTEDAVRDIRLSILSPPELAAKYGVHRSAIHSVLKGESWKHVK